MTRFLGDYYLDEPEPQRRPKLDPLPVLNPDVVPKETRTTAQLLADFQKAIQACDDARLDAAVQRGAERRQLRVASRRGVA
jgi:hypothetical protein